MQERRHGGKVEQVACRADARVTARKGVPRRSSRPRFGRKRPSGSRTALVPVGGDSWFRAGGVAVLLRRSGQRRASPGEAAVTAWVIHRSSVLEARPGWAMTSSTLPWHAAHAREIARSVDDRKDLNAPGSEPVDYAVGFGLHLSNRRRSSLRNGSSQAGESCERINRAKDSLRYRGCVGWGIAFNELDNRPKVRDGRLRPDDARHRGLRNRRFTSW
jgi:hypothetical protein